MPKSNNTLHRTQGLTPRASRTSSGRITGIAGLVSGALLAASVFASAPAGAAAKSIDTFDSTTAASDWKLSLGSEFPGAKGSLAIVTGRAGKGLAINYDFNGGGRYIAATRTLATPATIAALRFSIRAPSESVISVRVKDATGQQLTFKARRSLTAPGDQTWFSTNIELANPVTYYGGANDGVVHQPVNTIALRVETNSLHKQGTAVFDQLDALDSLNFSFDPTTAKVTATVASNLMQGVGVGIHASNDTAALDAAAGAGVRWVRTVLFWSQVERKPGVYDWAKWDTLVDDLDARGMKPIFTLAYANEELYAGWPPVSGTALTAFTAFAKAAAKHFAGRNVRFEIWNEPDHPNFWPGRDPVVYGRFAAQQIDAVHTGDPSALVSTGGVAWFDLNYYDKMLDSGAAVRADAVAIHPYRQLRFPETLADDTARLRAMIARKVAHNPPLWDTEWGYSSTQFGHGHSETARKRQAVMNIRRVINARVVGFPVVSLYSLRDLGTDPANSHDNFGLLTTTGAEKPTLVALRTLNRVAKDRRMSGVVELAQPLVNGVRFDSATDRVWMLWAATEKLESKLTVPKPLKATNMLGASITLGTSYTLREADGPIYLTYPRTDTTGSTSSAAELDAGEELDSENPAQGAGNDPTEPQLEPELETGAQVVGCQAGGAPLGHGTALAGAVLAGLLAARRRRAR